MCQERRRKYTRVDAELGTGAFGVSLQAPLALISAFESKAGTPNIPSGRLHSFAQHRTTSHNIAQHRTASHNIAQSFPQNFLDGIFRIKYLAK